jgi:hypothetical protein
VFITALDKGVSANHESRKSDPPMVGVAIRSKPRLASMLENLVSSMA